MGTASNDQGRAYEYAWISMLEEEVGKHRPVRVENNSSLDANRRAWEHMTSEVQKKYLTSAKSAVYCVTYLEPFTVEKSEEELILSFQADEAGTRGDVRDIVIQSNSKGWNTGLSIKHNHEAIKHSRLSRNLDFGFKWFGLSCSDEYWAAVAPIFDQLEQEKEKGTKWSDISNKDIDVYVPLLKAFIDEINRAYEKDNNVPRKMIEYLIGVCDYHKIVSNDAKKKTTVSSFNLHGTLGQGLKEGSELPLITLPTKLISLDFKENSTNTVEMILDQGWELSFRIHNASSRVEPSLKFDIQFITMPGSIKNYECEWS